MIRYDLGKDDYCDWVITEDKFSPNHLGKFESIFSLGNGYMGVRSATEECYYGESRDCLVNGTFNKADPTEVTELPNVADVTQIDIFIDGERFHLDVGEVYDYKRELNLKNAELVREFQWVSPNGKRFHFRFRRLVSLDDLHVIATKVEVKAVDQPAQLQLKSYINGQVSNHGAQHFLNGVPRFYDNGLLEYVQSTNESGIDVTVHSRHQVKKNGDGDYSTEPLMERRRVGVAYQLDLVPGETVELEKVSTVFTSRDKDFFGDVSDLKERSFNHINKLSDYNKLFKSHQKAWMDQVWDKYKVEVNSDRAYDQLALRFSIYHLTAMTPAHDERMGIGAKGLSGEGYKGHSFWDTEIFILPFFTYSNPKIARSLLTYRYLGLDSAHRKAEENGYRGAMFPWEMAFPSDGEVTPRYGDIDIVTGERSKIWSGLIEQHITADIAFAVYQYNRVTGDDEFLHQYGYEMVFDSAIFWASRLEWNAKHDRYEIHDVIGPDEYKEHVNNNAYTNYMSYFNLKLAIRWLDELREKNQTIFASLDEKLKLGQAYEEWIDKVEKIYLPQPNEDSVIPQDDTYFGLKQIDLTKYKKQEQARTIYKDYNQEQINDIQVTKQADVLVLIYLMEQTFLKDDLSFNKKLKEANFNFYEPRTLHDSSLSLSSHAILASDLGNKDLAYELFCQACDIDLGPNMKSSDDGIHAASIAGIWSIAVFGFGGVRVTADGLSVAPNLPESWRELSFNIQHEGEMLSVKISHEEVVISKEGNKLLKLKVNHEWHEFKDFLTVPNKLQFQ